MDVPRPEWAGIHLETLPCGCVVRVETGVHGWAALCWFGLLASYVIGRRASIRIGAVLARRLTYARVIYEPHAPVIA